MKKMLRSKLKLKTNVRDKKCTFTQKLCAFSGNDDSKQNMIYKILHIEMNVSFELAGFAHGNYDDIISN